MFSSISDFFTNKIWKTDLNEVSKFKSYGIKIVRVTILSLTRFQQDNCPLKAAALTLYSLLSIVPIFAMAFGIAKGFGFENILKQQLMARFPGQEEVITKIIEFAKSMLENTQGGVIAGIGVIFLFWTVIRMLSYIEHAFDGIWEVPKPRPLHRKFPDYLSIMIIAPFLLIISSSLTVFLSTQLRQILENIQIVALGHLVKLFIRLFSFLTLWLLFVFLYLFLPNTNINKKSAIVGGIIGGTIFQLAQAVYIVFQIGVTKYNAIYGSFAALPLFLIWLQLSWSTVLLGAEITYAHQFHHQFAFKNKTSNLSIFLKKATTISLMYLISKRFLEKESPPDIQQLSQHLGIPVFFLKPSLENLKKIHYVHELISEKENSISYVPAEPVNSISLYSIIHAMDYDGVNLFSSEETEILNKIKGILNEIYDQLKSSDRLIINLF